MDQDSSRQGSIRLRVAASTIGAAALFLFPCCFPLNFLAAVPCAQVRARLGPFHGWLVTALASLVVAVMSGGMFGFSKGLGFGLLFFGVVAAPAVVMTGWVVRGVRVDHAVLVGFLVCLVFMAMVFSYFTLEQGVSIPEFIKQNQVPADEMMTMLEGFVANDPRARDLAVRIYEGWPDFSFAWLAIYFLSGLSAMAVILSRSLFFGAPELFPVLDHQRVIVPTVMVWGFIICGLATLIQIDALQTWCYNILIILGFIYYLGGLSVLAWFLSRLGVPLVFKVLLFLLVLIYWLFAVVLAGVGLFDQWFDFRKLRTEGPGGPSGASADGGEDTTDA